MVTIGQDLFIPMDSLVIWTAVGLNEQSTEVGKEQFPRSDYPLAWYVGVNNGDNEEAFARKFANALREVQRSTLKNSAKEKVKIYEFEKNGRNVYGYFSDLTAFREVLEKVVGDQTLHVERFSGEIDRVTADDLWEKAQIAWNKAQERRKTA